MAINYEGTIKFTNFIGARVQEIEDDDGIVEECIVIPIEKNGFKKSRYNNVYCQLFINESRYSNTFLDSHYFRLRVDKEHCKRMEELGFKSPFVGSMKPTKFKYNQKSGESKRVSTEIINDD